MILDPESTIIAVVSFMLGAASMFPWRGFVRRRIQRDDVVELTRLLHEAMAVLDSQDVMRADPTLGVGEGAGI